MKDELSIVWWLLGAGLIGGAFWAHHVLYPPLGQAREKARRINCAGNLKQIGLALIIYAGDDAEHEMFPDGEEFELLHQQQYLVDGKVYVCPSCDDPRPSAKNSNFVYRGAGLSYQVRDEAKVVIAHDEPGNHRNWMNLLFADGHVRGYRAHDLNELEALCRREGLTLPGHRKALPSYR